MKESSKVSISKDKKVSESIESPKIQQDHTKTEEINRKLYPLHNTEKFTGKTLEIYYYLAKNPGFHGVREIQRKFDYSSPNLSKYHLDRLWQANVIMKNDQNKYGIITDDIRLGSMEYLVKIANFWIPRSIVYAIIVFILALSSIIFFFADLSNLTWFLIFTPYLIILGVRLLKDGYDMSQKLSKGL